jgi:peptide/nickel transport system substrate-binding protein
MSSNGKPLPPHWDLLWDDLRPEDAVHEVNPGTLGEYAAVLERDGHKAATAAFPEVAAHLEATCPRCAVELQELVTFAAAESGDAQNRSWPTITQKLVAFAAAELRALVAFIAAGSRDERNRSQPASLGRPAILTVGTDGIDAEHFVFAAARSRDAQNRSQPVIGAWRIFGLVAIVALAAVLAASTVLSNLQLLSIPYGEPDVATALPATIVPQASAAGKPTYGGTLVGTLSVDPVNLDPMENGDLASNVVLANVADSLFEITPQATIIGCLVDTYATPQSNVYVLHLHPGVKFQDGTDLDAAAVMFNLDRYRHDPNSAQRQNLAVISSVQTVDANTVQITLTQPFAPFLRILAGRAGYILSPTAVQSLGGRLQRDLTGAGSGPFELTSWQPNSQIVLSRNPAYWRKSSVGQLPYLDQLVLKIVPAGDVMVKDGAADVVIGPAMSIGKDSSLRSRSDLSVQDTSSLSVQMLVLNTRQPPFNDPAARRALFYALDRTQIGQQVYSGAGKPSDTPVPRIIGWAHPLAGAYLTRDVSRARQELATISSPLYRGGFHFTLKIGIGSVWQKTAELIRDQAQEAGFGVTVDPIDFQQVLNAGREGTFDAIGFFDNTSVDPDSLAARLSLGGSLNYSGYKNSAVNTLFENGRRTLDQTARASIYLQIQQILYQDQPVIVLYEQPQVLLARKSVQDLPAMFDVSLGAFDLGSVWKTPG